MQSAALSLQSKLVLAARGKTKFFIAKTQSWALGPAISVTKVGRLRVA